MIISMIVAHGRNRVIGVGNVMPWHIPADLKFFKAKTLGRPVVMGRKTFQSIGHPLPGRPNIVITRDGGFSVEGITCVSSLDEAVEVAKLKALELDGDEIMIVGGGQIYEQMLARAKRLYLTEIDLAPEGDAFFPDYRTRGNWSESWREHHEAEGDQPAFDFAIYERV